MPEGEDVISIAKEFSAYPAGRDENDGPNNGQKFRDTILKQRLQQAIGEGRKLVVSLDGVLSFGSSFLEEAFGGLVRSGFKKQEIKRSLEVRSSSKGSERYVAAIARYIERAVQKQ